MNIGQLRHRVTLQNPSGTPVPDGEGGFTHAYVNLTPATVSADVRPATARDLERVTANTTITSATHIVTMRYHAGVTTATRITFKGRTLYVRGVSNPEEKNEMTICVCEELS